MPHLSQTASVVPASPIRKLVPYAEAAKARGLRVYHLNIGQPDIESPAEALTAIRQMKAQILEYTHSAGNLSYRQALADFYSLRLERDVTTENIVVTTGGSEAAMFALMATCNAGDEVIVPEPFYANYNSFALELGVKIIPVKSDIENDFALPPIEDFDALVTPRTRGVIICNPNNPTGYLYTKDEIIALRDFVVRRGLFLISDEVYSDFCYDGKQFFSTLSLDGADENIIMIDSVSKRYSMCGARIGVIVSRNCGVMDAALRFGQARLCAPFVGQLAAEAATRNTPQEYFDAINREYTSRRNLLVTELRKMPGVVCPMPRGAFYATVQLPVDNAETFAIWLLEEFSYKDGTVMLAPAQGFYGDHESCPQNQVRIAYVLNTEDLAAAMEALAEALRVYPGRR